MTEDKRAGWHHHLNGQEFQQTLGESEGQGSLECCSPWGSQRVGHNLVTGQKQELKFAEQKQQKENAQRAKPKGSQE